MVRLRGVIPLALALGQVEAFSEHVGWAPAKQTPDAVDKELGIVTAPVQTASPARFGELKLKRQFDVIEANTCGYIDGEASGGVTCNAALGSECITEPVAQAVGCCATESCNIWTACLDRTDSSATATEDMDRTRYCSDSASAFCAIYEYVNKGDIEGYTMHLCDSTRTTYSFFQTFSGFVGQTSTTRTRRTTTLSESSSGTSASGGASSSQAPNNNVAEEDGGAPVGAIVGGVIGGIAVIAVIGVALFFILRKKRGAHQPVPQQVPGMPGTPGFMPGGPNQYPQSPNPQMYGHVPQGVPSMYMAGPPPPHTHTPDNAGGVPPQGYYYPPQDPRSSMMKPASPVSTMGYAPPSSTSPAMTYADTPNLQPQHTGYSQQSHVPLAGYPPHAMQQQQHQHMTPPPPMSGPPPMSAPGPAPVELPTTRPDGELRELA